MKTTLHKNEKWHPSMPKSLRLPQVRYSRSRFVCRADFPPHMLARAGDIMHHRADRVERQTNDLNRVLLARREWHAQRGTQPPPQTHPLNLFPPTMTLNSLLSQVRRSARRTRQTLHSLRRKPLLLATPRPKKAA